MYFVMRQVSRHFFYTRQVALPTSSLYAIHIDTIISIAQVFKAIFGARKAVLALFRTGILGVGMRAICIHTRIVRIRDLGYDVGVSGI